jgi:hypothetical protein
VLSAKIELENVEKEGGDGRKSTEMRKEIKDTEKEKERKKKNRN